MAAYGHPGFAPMNPYAYNLFIAVDRDRSGAISLSELQLALSNGGYSAFNVRTTKQLLRMYDADGSGTLGYPEFEQLLGLLNHWKSYFEAADRDRSGRLSHAEAKGLLASLGYRLPEPVMDTIIRGVDDDASGHLSFDELIALLAELYMITSQFQKFDTTRTGRATLDYAALLHIIYSVRV